MTDGQERWLLLDFVSRELNLQVGQNLFSEPSYPAQELESFQASMSITPFDSVQTTLAPSSIEVQKTLTLTFRVKTPNEMDNWTERISAIFRWLRLESLLIGNEVPSAIPGTMSTRAWLTQADDDYGRVVGGGIIRFDIGLPFADVGENIETDDGAAYIENSVSVDFRSPR